jgi:hypothetical protein
VQQFIRVILLCVGLLLVGRAAGAAPTAIAVLGFELNDLTGLPSPPEELQRTASIQPLLQEALAQRDGYRVIQIDAHTVKGANAGFGYLFDHPDAAAKLGSAFGADWVIVGRVHKPSFLFAYIMAHLVNTHSGALVREYVVEVKGRSAQVTPKGVARLAEQIERTIRSGSD